MITWLKRPMVGIPLVVLVVLSGGVLILQNTGNADGSTVAVGRGSVTETVAVSGRVKAPSRVELALQKTGRVTATHHKVGDTIMSGDIIVETYAGDLQAKLMKEQAALEALLNPARSEEVLIAQSKKRAAETTLKARQDDLFEKIRAAYTAIDDAVRNKTDQFIDNPTISAAKLNFPVVDVDLARTVGSERYELEQNIVALYKVLPSTAAAVTPALVQQTQQTLIATATFLADFARAMNSLTASTAYPQATISAWKTDIGTTRNTVTTATQALIAADQDVEDAIQNVQVTTQELAIKNTGGSNTDRRAQEAVVSSIGAQLEETLIRAPFDGMITRQDAVIGQTLSAGETVVAMSAQGDYEIEINIPEVTVSKVSVGDKAHVTLDAFGSASVFDAEVTSLDLSEKIIDGVPSYKANLRFLKHDPRIKTGMTANVSIVTAEKSSVLIIPERAAVLRDAVWHVTRVVGGDDVDTIVVLGIRGGGIAEVVSGLSAGDVIKLP